MFVPDLSSIKIPARPKTPSAEEIKAYCERIAEKLKKNNAVLIAHYYTSPEVQQLAEMTGGTASILVAATIITGMLCAMISPFLIKLFGFKYVNTH